MRESRFPPFLSGPSIAAACLAGLGVLVALFCLGGYSPFWLLIREGLIASGTFLLVLAFCSVLLYRLIAPPIWSFSRRYVPPPQPKLPPDLVVTVLRETPFDCPVCRYSLRGLGSPVCPECSTPVTLFLVGQRPASGRWNGLVFVWLALSLVASALASFVLCFSWWQGYTASAAYFSMYGVSPWLPNVQYRIYHGLLTDLLACGLAVAGTLICLYWCARALQPKAPHLQSQLARRAAAWLSALSALWTLLAALQMGAPLVLRLWY